MQVKATKQGHDGLTVREPGEVFAMPDGSTGSWFETAPQGEVVPPAEDDKPKGRRAKAAPQGEVVPPDPPAA